MSEKKLKEVKSSFMNFGAERVDRDLPLGLRINALAEISAVDFILGGDDLKIKHPGDSCIVASFGYIASGRSDIHRFYLESEKTVYMLQVVTDERKNLQEIKLFMPLDEVYPEDWGFWLSEKDGYIGMSVFQTKDGAQYYRVWENPGAEIVLEDDGRGNRITRIPPVQFMEKICFDEYGRESEIVKYDSMLYGRHVNDNADEYLLVSAVSERDGASVQLMVGMELGAAALKVI
jgi:hypothetical protein